MRRTTMALLLGSAIAASNVAVAQAPPADAPVPSPDPDPPAPKVDASPERDDVAETDESETEPDRGTNDEETEDPRRAKAREAFLRGVDQAKKARWSEALASFESSAKLRPLAVTTYNVGASLRALGRYLAAKKAFEEALRQDADGSFGELSETLRSDTRAFISEIDKLLGRAVVTLKPRTAKVAVDGRPLELAEKGEVPVMLAGTRAAGNGEAPPAGRFDVLLNPGAHVFTLSRKGYADAVVNETFAPGETRKLDLSITKLPAKLRVSATEDRAVVTVDGRDVGQAPLELSRREGEYKVSVFKEGFVPYETTVALDPGQRMNLRADLAEQEPALYEEWWFWAAVGAGVTAAALTTYFIVRPEPERPAPICGGLDWCITVPGS